MNAVLFLSSLGAFAALREIFLNSRGSDTTKNA